MCVHIYVSVCVHTSDMHVCVCVLLNVTRLFLLLNSKLCVEMCHHYKHSPFFPWGSGEAQRMPACLGEAAFDLGGLEHPDMV